MAFVKQVFKFLSLKQKSQFFDRINSIKNFSNKASDVLRLENIPLTQRVPWIEEPIYAKANFQQNDTHITTLDNGIKVVSNFKFGIFCTVGVLIDSGSRYEVDHMNGISHFLEKLAFGPTAKFGDRDAIMRRLEKHGGICDCQGSRDTLIYALSASVEGLPEVIELLSQVTLNPLITNEEIENARLSIQFELESLEMRPDPEPLLVELIHSAAYNSNTVGLAKICPVENLEKIDRTAILNYINQYHTPDRMVIAGVGMEHEALVNLVKKYFTSQPIWSNDQCLKSKPEDRDLSVAQYTGGSKEVIKDLSDVSLGPNPMPDLAHFVIGLESCSHKDSDFVAYCVLNMMMGGGGSFSAGGPGKGMYTRLYTNVLNKHHWIHNATAFNHAYNDTGLFCIHASVHPGSLKEVVDVILQEIINIQNGIGSEELNRAKTQLESMLLMNLEARPVVFEDIGRQVLANGKRMPSEYYCQLIRNITETDVHRVAKRMLHSRPSVAALGNLNELPKFEDIRKAISGHSDSLFTLKRFSNLFSH